MDNAKRVTEITIAGLIVLASCALTTIAMDGCSVSAVKQQSEIAHQAARAWNGVARPALVAEYEREAVEEIINACPRPPCARTSMVASLHRVQARWVPVWAALESVRVAHDVWRGELERCRSTSTPCDPSTLNRYAGAFVTHLASWRCSMRAIGHAELDPVPGQLTCGGRDGG